jgi:hypothetical protein
MTARIGKVALCFGLLTLLPGCVEMTQTITLNPDGRGKMKIEMLVAAFDFDLDMGPMPGAPGGKKEKSLDEIKKEFATKFVCEAPGVTAFKDVTVKWARDGRLHLIGTAYFERMEDLEKADKPPQQGFNVQPATYFSSSFKVTLDKKKATMHITAKNQGVKDGLKPLDQKGGSVDLDKVGQMSDKEIDEYMLKPRVDYQKAKPLLRMVFNDLKIKTVVHLPGDIVKAKGVKKDDKRTVSQSFEGAAILAGFEKLMMMDNADLKKLATSKSEKDLLALFGPMATYGELDVTAHELGGPQFDYDKEVREARAAYPALRKSLRLDDSARLPGE